MNAVTNLGSHEIRGVSLLVDDLATQVGALERVCSQTQLCQLRCFNGYTRQLHVSAPTGHLQVVFKRT